MQNNTTKKNSKKNSGEQAFCLFLILLAIFEVILVTVTLVTTLPANQTSSNLPPNAENESDTLPPPDTATPSVSVFSGGVLPPRPYTSAATVTLTGELDSKFAILIDAETGEILAQKGAEIAFSPASMTKVMTLIVACEQLKGNDLERKIPLTDEIVTYVTSGNYEGTGVALPTQTSSGLTCIGDTYRIKDLLYGIGVASAADCTYMIAKEVGGSEEAFVALMNQKATALGLTGTHFDNAVGFDSETNVTTARDMAVIMAYAMQSDLISDILKPREEQMIIYAHYTENGAEKTYKVYFTPSLESRMEKYPAFSLRSVNLTATKTGYTDQSFIVCAAKSKTNGKQYIVVLGESDTNHPNLTAQFKATMIDLERLYNLYVK